MKQCEEDKEEEKSHKSETIENTKSEEEDWMKEEKQSENKS